MGQPGVPSTNTIFGPNSREALQGKTKLGAPMELPGLFYTQYTPTAATISSGTVTSNGMSLVGALQLGLSTASTAPLGGDAVVTASSSSGLLISFTTSSFMPTTLNYDQMPVKFTTTTGTLPTGLVAGVTYYWQWVSATTGHVALTPNGASIAYTDAGSGTFYCQAATQYWGSPWLPAGFFQASDMLNQATPSSAPYPGCMIRIEIDGHKIGTGTNNFTISPGLYSTAGTFTALTAGSVQAAVNAGPFPFFITTDITIQQYGQTAVTSPYTAIAMVKTVSRQQVFSTANTNTWATNVFAKTVSLDLTQSYAIDVRYLAATPVVGEYMEPLNVRMWAFN
jgi:hypothetical protein